MPMTLGYGTAASWSHPRWAFYGARGDLLATAAMGGWPSADEVSIAVALDSWKPTRGTLLAGENTAGRRVALSGHRLRILPGDQPPPSGIWDFPAPFGTQEVVGEFPTTDVVTIARHLDVADVHAFINRAPLADLDEPYPSGPQAADESGRSAQTFLVDVVVRRGGERRRAVARGRDIYAFHRTDRRGGARADPRWSARDRRRDRGGRDLRCRGLPARPPVRAVVARGHPAVEPATRRGFQVIPVRPVRPAVRPWRPRPRYRRPEHRAESSHDPHPGLQLGFGGAGGPGRLSQPTLLATRAGQ